MPKKTLLLCLFTAILISGYAQQQIGFSFNEGRKKVSLDFTLVNNLIIIPVTINNRITLKFILDTGANNPILTERVFGDIIGLEYDRTILISGPGIVDSISAYVANNVSFNFEEGIRGQRLSMLVLEEDYIQLKKNVGEDIFGIFGYNVFSRFVVEIDYDDRQLTFYSPENYKAPRKYTAFKMDIENTKPYIETILSQNNSSDTVRLMIDTGASHALLLDLNETKTITRPDSMIATSLGHGLGGEIPGNIGRINELKVGNFKLPDILVSVPDEGAYSNSIKRGSRHGTIGGGALNRFNPIIDYNNGYLYLRKSHKYGDIFKYDMSGLRLSFFDNPQRIEITGITKNSPADQIGLQTGDVVISVNGMNIFDNRLTDIYNLLKSKPYKKIRITILREGVKMDYKFRLRKMI